MGKAQALYADIVCWIALISAVWLGPQWMIKVALTVIIVWNMLAVRYLVRQSK